MVFSLSSIGNPDSTRQSAFEKIVDLSERALVHGDVSAMKVMGKHLEEAEYLDRSFMYYLKAAGTGDREAIERLKVLYNRGAGNPIQRLEAIFYFGIQKCARIFQRQS